LSLNYRDIDLLLQEMDLQGSFLQEIIQYDYHHLIFQFYKPGLEQRVLISLMPQALRIHRTEEKHRALSKPPRFTAFLKSRIKGSKLQQSTQLGRERIIRWDFSKGEESFRLYIKLWENNSNLILCDKEGIILDCFSRRPKRMETPGKPWDEQKVPQSKGKEREPQDFPGQGDLNLRVAKFYKDRERERVIRQIKEGLKTLLNSEITSLSTRLNKQQQLKDKGDSSRLKELGDLIMTYQHQIQQGDSWLEISLDSTLQRIELNPRLDPWANAQEYYTKYKKKKRQEKQDQSPTDLHRLYLLEQRQKDLEECQDISILKTWLEESKNSSTKKAVKSQGPGLQFIAQGFIIRAGRNARENDALLRKARGNDTWLHCRDYPGGYVFISGPKGKTIPLDVLLDAANLALVFSKAKEQTLADMHYTQVKYLRRAKNGPKGLVIPTQEKNLSIRKDPQRLKRLYHEN
jgi:predicted ribosome quality control (RQC) complex YloA/Tae2 family protein